MISSRDEKEEEDDRMPLCSTLFNYRRTNTTVSWRSFIKHLLQTHILLPCNPQGEDLTWKQPKSTMMRSEVLL